MVSNKQWKLLEMENFGLLTKDDWTYSQTKKLNKIYWNILKENEINKTK